MRVIFLEGNIGAGKTSLLTALGEHFGDRVRIVDQGVACAAAGAEVHSAMLRGALADDGNTVASVGAHPLHFNEFDCNGRRGKVCAIPFESGRY